MPLEPEWALCGWHCLYPSLIVTMGPYGNMLISILFMLNQKLELS